MFQANLPIISLLLGFDLDQTFSNPVLGPPALHAVKVN